jgi:glucose-6-phosphatase
MNFLRFFKFEGALGLLSTIFNPTMLYLYFIPLSAALHTKLYHKLIISCIASDFSNLILKWILSEDRPYYFVHESSAYKLTRPTLYQTERTCETSPGSPSGHLMIASCFLYIIYDEINNQIEKRVAMREKKMKLMKILNRLALIAILTLTAVSRMYFATHFLHQTLLGAVLGTLIAMIIASKNGNEFVVTMSKKSWFLTGLGMVLLTTTIYWMHKLISGNPMYSVQMAFKYCKDPLYPKPETTVIFSAIRSVGLIFGIVLNAPILKR